MYNLTFPFSRFIGYNIDSMEPIIAPRTAEAEQNISTQLNQW